jgi:hypothetical protein
MIYGPKDDGTYVAAEGEALAISIPRTETTVIRQLMNCIRSRQPGSLVSVGYVPLGGGCWKTSER